MLTLKYKNIKLSSKAYKKRYRKKWRNTSLDGRNVDVYNLILQTFQYFSIVLSEI